jgi:hypothetical protein
MPRHLIRGHSLFVPVLSPLLRDRRLVLAITVVTFLQLGLTSVGLPGWPCPFLHVVGIPCPGCGLTRAMILLLRGDWRRSLAFHAFAPLFIVALMIAITTALLPESVRQRIVTSTEVLELRTGITGLLLVGLILYWLARLFVLQSAFVQLIQG